METKKLACPCIDCLCKPLCKNKTYTGLMKCSLVYKYLYTRAYPYEEIFSDRIKSIMSGLEIESIPHLGYELKY